ncbi:hypothetical protein GFL01_10095 [Pseudomonas stutzeri]|nr:hypothetical protein [Stutzerimonas frequens]MBK3910664.1 hypothetical protein [Stutzerimonas frequens]MBK3929925.1 hypothetical protein [Stutzerimonas frequens]
MSGVGGRTIAEARERISYPEFLSWLKYRAKRGSLNVGMRVERGTALLASLYVNAHRGKDTQPAQMWDFAPHHDQPVVSLDEAMEKWV